MKHSKQNKLAVIVHGYKGSTNDAWKPWLAHELKKRGYMVRIPRMPDPGNPQVRTWTKAVSQAVEDHSGPLILIGHSLGGNAIL